MTYHGPPDAMHNAINSFPLACSVCGWKRCPRLQPLWERLLLFGRHCRQMPGMPNRLHHSGVRGQQRQHVQWCAPNCGCLQQHHEMSTENKPLLTTRAAAVCQGGRGDAQCQTCPKGTWSAGDTMNPCNSCPQGYSTELEGCIAYAQCKGEHKYMGLGVSRMW
jgi:hypothetical protein